MLPAKNTLTMDKVTGLISYLLNAILSQDMPFTNCSNFNTYFKDLSFVIPFSPLPYRGLLMVWF